MSLGLEDIERARLDPVVFAEVLLGAPLWDHQIEVVRSSATYRVICAGRRSGKTHVFGVLSLHLAFSVAGSKVLIVSAGDDAAKTMFDAITVMVKGSESLRSSVIDELARELLLSNGSRIKCVPSSMKQVRSQEADLLIVDEAGFVAQAIWQAAEPVTVARPGSRILLSSSPWGGPGHFFHDLWRQGMDAPSADVESWHWPSTVSPQVDQQRLEAIRQHTSPWEFATEYLAEWVGASGAYFTESELMRSVADYELLDPADALERGGWWMDGPGWLPCLPAAAGVDWGFARDANALVLVAPLEDYGLNDEQFGEGRRVLFVPWLEMQHNWPYTEFIDRVVQVSQSYAVEVIASERNGVGQSPTMMLRSQVSENCLQEVPLPWVSAVWTDARRKMTGFGQIKGMLQRGQLVLPRHPELLKQLRGLEFEQTESGTTKISVPERSGHDDLAMALMQAVSCVNPDQVWWSPGSRLDPETRRRQSEYRGAVEQARQRAPPGELEVVETASGIRVPARPAPLRDAGHWVHPPSGREKGDGW